MNTKRLYLEIYLPLYTKKPDINPAENWVISKINNPHIFVGRLNNEYKKKITMGGVIPYVDIINRLKLGYYKYKTPGWKIENDKNVPITE